MYYLLRPWTLGRMVGLAACMLPFVIWWKSIDHDVTLVSEADITGSVISVTEKTLSGKFGKTTMRFAKVRLPDGGEARISVRRSGIATGQSIDLRLREFSDGSREVAALY